MRQGQGQLLVAAGAGVVGVSASCLAFRTTGALCENVQDEGMIVQAPESTMARREPPSRFLCVWRLLTLLAYALPLAGLLPFCQWLGSDWLWDQYRKLVVGAVVRYGATAVKLGQWASSRKDLFGEDAGNMLPCELHTCVEASGATPEELQRAREVCKTSGAKLMESEPLEEIGSGCVANVFKGKKEDGTDVVVKVLRKNTRSRMEADLVVLQWLERFACKIQPDLEALCLGEALREFSTHMQIQTDLSVEGRNLERMRRDFQEDTFIRLPEVHGTPTEEVLVQSYVGGYHLADILKPGFQDGILGDAQVRKLVSLELGRAFCKMLFVNNLTHLDLHPGNIKVCFTGDPREKPLSIVPDWIWDRLPMLTADGLTNPENNESKLKVPMPVLGLVDMLEARWAKVTGAAQFQLVFLDLGMALSIKPSKMQMMRNSCGAAVQGDVSGAGRAMFDAHRRLGRVPRGSHAVQEAFEKDMGSLMVSAVRYSNEWARFFKSYTDYIKAGTGEYLGIACNIFSSSKIRMDPEVYCACAAVALVEGSMRSCFKECSIARCALPFLLPKMEWLHRLNTSSATV